MNKPDAPILAPTGARIVERFDRKQAEEFVHGSASEATRRAYE
jgi:hypothetical protein